MHRLDPCVDDDPHSTRRRRIRMHGYSSFLKFFGGSVWLPETDASREMV
jgi:hypothetical protein